MMKRHLTALILLAAFPLVMTAQTKSLHQLQQEFVDLRFGMFVHFGLPTFQNADWTDPHLDAGVFNPTRLDTHQWVSTAKSAGCTFICVSVKHHAGFCMWNTATTDYNVMNTPLGRDVLKELTTALREAGMQVMFHFSILDTHHGIRHTLPFTREKTDFIKAQLRELLTGYGPVNTIMFDGWDAPWGRISYTDVSFPEIYAFVKSLQPNCLVMDLNGAKYPKDALFYSDISCYEQGAGQRISADDNRLPAMACYPLQRTWFWKESFPTDELKDVDKIVQENIIPYNKAYCTYILNAAPNREGLIDPNAVDAMRHIGPIWKNTGHLVDVPEAPEPIIDINMAVGRKCDSSWSDDMNLMDFANDDQFNTCWVSSPEVQHPWWMVELDEASPIGMVVVTEGKNSRLEEFEVEIRQGGLWKTVDRQSVSSPRRVHISRFTPVEGEAVRVRFIAKQGMLSIAEIGVYPQKNP
jgi:alpha-L-fucosidase